MCPAIHSFHMVLLDQDHKFYERELASFLPDKIFDAHLHLWPAGTTGFGVPDFEGDAGYPEYLQCAEQLHPGRKAPGLFLSFAIPSAPQEREKVNEWVARQTAADPNNRGLFFVTPDDDPEWVREEVRRLGLHGLKCYHTFAKSRPTWEAEIPDFLPEALVKVAHEEGWAITLHMVRSRAVADPNNIHWIRHYCETYPGMKLILAHSARGFQPAHNLEGLPQLVGLENVYFDSSANCEPMAHQAVIRILGHERLMYGSDFPVSHLRGRHVGAADEFLWLYEDSPVWQEKQGNLSPVLIGLEHLRSIKWACWSERLEDSAIEDIFWNNAARLFDLK